MGWGFLTGLFVAGLFMGLGIGFLAFAIVNLLSKKK
jgi:H+/Cl- antiporter ClcA